MDNSGLFQMNILAPTQFKKKSAKNGVKQKNDIVIGRTIHTPVLEFSNEFQDIKK